MASIPTLTKPHRSAEYTFVLISLFLCQIQLKYDGVDFVLHTLQKLDTVHSPRTILWLGDGSILSTLLLWFVVYITVLDISLDATADDTSDQSSSCYVLPPLHAIPLGQFDSGDERTLGTDLLARRKRHSRTAVLEWR
jgi:hypothetical protein